MDKFKRKEIVDRFNALAAQIDEIMTDAENERLHDEMDRIWYKELDDIAMVQVDPLRVGPRALAGIELVSKKAVSEGDFVRFTAQIHDLQLDEWDALDALVPWNRLDLCNPVLYDELCGFWNIERPQDMDFYDKYWIPRRIHDS